MHLYAHRNLHLTLCGLPESEQKLSSVGNNLLDNANHGKMFYDCIKVKRINCENAIKAKKIHKLKKIMLSSISSSINFILLENYSFSSDLKRILIEISRNDLSSLLYRLNKIVKNTD